MTGFEAGIFAIGVFLATAVGCVAIDKSTGIREKILVYLAAITAMIILGAIF